MPQPLQGLWFDGRSSRAQPVRVVLQPGQGGPALALHLPGQAQPALVLQHAQVGWPEAWGRRRAPPQVVVDLHGEGSLQVDDVAGWQAALQAAGHAPPLAERMQTRWSVFALVLVLAAACLFAFYRWGTPWVAGQLTRQVPLAWETSLSAKVLTDLDAGTLKPSRVPPERQAELRRRFETLAQQVPPGLRRYRAYAPPLVLQFRRGLGANAFALPGGTIVITDGMLELAARQQLPDDAVLGVLAHEVGHVLHRHTTRMVVEQGVLNVGLGLALGDVSSIVSTGASLLTGLAYRRGHETEADCFAVGLLRQAGLATAPMADLLLRIEADEAAGAGGASDASAWTRFLSSHPETPQRARDLKQGHPPGCR
jgi:Zn-dependent protease with chaperone function